jgi:hypothetical protein
MGYSIIKEDQRLMDPAGGCFEDDFGSLSETGELRIDGGSFQ